MRVSARTATSIYLSIGGVVLFGIGPWLFLLPDLPVYVPIATIVVGLALVLLAIWLSPIGPRRPRGGPMDDPDKTIVLPRRVE